jgi:hypothetical protein
MLNWLMLAGQQTNGTGIERLCFYTFQVGFTAIFKETLKRHFPPPTILLHSVRLISAVAIFFYQAGSAAK